MTTSEKIAIAGIVTSALVSIFTAIISHRSSAKEQIHPSLTTPLRINDTAAPVLSMIRLVLWAIMLVAFSEAAFNAYQGVLVFQTSQQSIAPALPRFAVATACLTVMIIALAVRKHVRRLSG